jgi:hypothetical protein
MRGEEIKNSNRKTGKFGKRVGGGGGEVRYRQCWRSGPDPHFLSDSEFPIYSAPDEHPTLILIQVLYLKNLFSTFRFKKILYFLKSLEGS